MNKFGKKEAGIVGTISILVVFIIVGILLINQSEEQKSDISDEGYQLTKGIGGWFLFFGVIFLIILVLIGILVFLKKVGIIHI